MALLQAPPFQRGKSAGGYMTKGQCRSRCISTTLRELTSLTTSQKFHHWLEEKSGQKTRSWAMLVLLLLCLSASITFHQRALVNEISDELTEARDTLTLLQNSGTDMPMTTHHITQLKENLQKEQQQNVELLSQIEDGREKIASLRSRIQDLTTKVSKYEEREESLNQQEAELKEAERLASELYNTATQKQRLTPDGQAMEALAEIAMVRKFYLWVCITMAAVLACSSGKLLQQWHQLAQMKGLWSSQDASTKQGPEENKYYLDASQRPQVRERGGLQLAVGKNEDVGVAEKAIQTFDADSTRFTDSPDSLQTDKNVKKEQLSKIEEENKTLNGEADELFNILSRNVAARNRKKLAEQMHAAFVEQDGAPSADDSEITESSPTGDALSLTADGEMEYDSKGESSTEYYSQALAVLLGASSTVIDDDDDPCDHEEDQTEAKEGDEACGEPDGTAQLYNEAILTLEDQNFEPWNFEVPA